MLRLKTPLEVRCMAILYVYMVSSTKISRKWLPYIHIVRTGMEHRCICIYIHIYINIEEIWLRNVYGVKYEMG